MKTTCDFCKTEYSLDAMPNSPVRCPICGYTWTVARPNRRNAWLVFLAAICALLAAIMFAFVAVSRHQIVQRQNQPLVANVVSADTVTDASGVEHFVVTGTVLNQSDKIYGVPDLIIVTMDDDEKVINQQKFMPSATLLDPGASVTFTHTLAAPTAGVKKITARLAEHGDTK